MSRLFGFCFLLVFLTHSLQRSAHAAEMSLMLEGPTRYHAEVYIASDATLLYLSAENYGANVKEQLLAMEISCSGTLEGATPPDGPELDAPTKQGLGRRLGQKLASLSKPRWVVLCDIERASIKAVAGTPDFQSTLELILDEYEQLLPSAVIELVFTEDGHIKTIDLQNIDDSQVRTRAIAELLLSLIETALAPLDIHLPDPPEVEPADRWQHEKRARAFGIALTPNPVGSAELTYNVVSVDGTVVRLQSSGQANMGTSEWKFSLDGEGEAVFDSGDGTWLHARFVTSGILGNTLNARSVDYAQAAWISRVEPDGSMIRPEPSKEASDSPPSVE